MRFLYLARVSLVEFRKEGFYVPQADVYIDPWRKVRRAIVTHGHSDHSRPGHGAYACTALTEPIIRHRLGKIKVTSYAFGESFVVNGVRFSFVPAGHIVGSAQVRIEYKGEVWVISGDYKIEDDGFSGAFEVVPCHAFVSECTFGLPVYSWIDQRQVFEDINAWWSANRALGITTVLTGYTLGKAQRLLCGVDANIGPIYTHGAVEQINVLLREAGIQLPETQAVAAVEDRKKFAGALIVAPPSATGTPWLKRFGQVSIGAASGWMQLRGPRRRSSVDRGFVLSDHADWQGLNDTISATGAERIFVTHGYTHVFSKWLRSQGLDAKIVETQFSNEGEAGSAVEEVI